MKQNVCGYRLQLTSVINNGKRQELTPLPACLHSHAFSMVNQKWRMDLGYLSADYFSEVDLELVIAFRFEKGFVAICGDKS